MPLSFHMDFSSRYFDIQVMQVYHDSIMVILTLFIILSFLIPGVIELLFVFIILQILLNLLLMHKRPILHILKRSFTL